MREHRPLRTLSLLVGGALVLLVALVGPSARGDVPTPGWFRPLAPADTDSVAVDVARADTDSVAVQPVLLRLDTLRAAALRTLADSLGIDSLRALATLLGVDSLTLADSLAPPDTNYRVQRYLRALQRDQQSASLFPRDQRPFSTRLGGTWRHELTLDSTGQYYVARETVGSEDVRYPLEVDPDRFREEKLKASMERNWRQLIEQHAQQRRQRQSGGLGLNITVPGGRQSAFTTIFGKNEVDLRVTGNADIRTGFDYRKSDQQVTLGTGARLDPDFKQNLRLGVTGSIGDKMRVDVNWDTERDFDYQNQLKLQYTGYEDEILQSVEAGNVFLQTPSTLIRGGQSLFGIKSEFQMGGFHLTTVASQQEGQSNSLSLEGGAETTSFNLKPTQYDERKHFFLAYYFRNRWEDAFSQPPTPVLGPGFDVITDLEVWKLTLIGPEEQNVRQIAAVVDLGEPPALLTQADAFTSEILPNDLNDQYSDEEIEQRLRPGDETPQNFLESAEMDLPLDASDYQVGQFKKLPRSEYEFDELLGFITLNTRLQEGEALAVSFRYLSNGQEIQVGDFSSQTGGGDNSQTGDRLVLKLLKPVNLKQPANLGAPDAFNPAAWYLEMRNLYSIGGRLSANEFDLQISYEPSGGKSTKTLPGISGQQTLIQVLGLDRLNEDGNQKPDNRFDYLTNYTIIPGEGLLIFPTLEPFGQTIANLIAESNLSEEEKATARSQFVFDGLYTQKKTNAQLITQLDVYRIQGSSKGSIPSFYDLRAFSGLVEGSVRVTSGGTTLTEGTDYIVDYQGGTVNIINPSYLTAGRDIAIDYEQNALINLQKKTLLGARLDYTTDERLEMGATVMRLSQKSITDKFRIGDEPIANTIWGVDGKLNLEPRWLTRAVDALPFIQTKEPSIINITGEFAQFRPGHTQTNAFKDERRDLQKAGLDFKDDEIAGISYVDDFEGFENLFSLNRPGAWLLGSAPVIGIETGGTGMETELTNDTRAAMAWYQINATTLEQLGKSSNDPVVGLVSTKSVFPNRETVGSQDNLLTTLDLFFTPHQRGPYNYNTDLGGFLDNPKEAWGGMTQRLTEGNTDFTSKNIEFVEFVFQPSPDGSDAGPDARLYVDLGQISEDVIPDNKLNTEDGLSLADGGPVGTMARLPTGVPDQVINPINTSDRITEDLGLDGLASFPNNRFEGQEGSEAAKFQEFLNALTTTTSARYPDQLAREIAKAQRDPSGDDYHYFLNNGFFENARFYPPGGASVQERFTNFFATTELNSFEAQTKLSDASTARGNSRLPDTEVINLNSTLDTENSYYQYELPLSLATLDELAQPNETDDYVVEEIKDANGVGRGWYLVRIPVKDFTRRVGNIQDFNLIESIRLWTTGHERPITMRFATLEFVGSQWRKSVTVSEQNADGELLPPDDDPIAGARLSIESVNNEENSSYAIPNGTIRTRIRDATSGRQRDAREQSMVLRVENLKPGYQQGLFQAYTTAQDLLKYSNLRMFVHLDGIANGMPLQEEDRGKVRLFVRLGANETNDYYEYEQPLTPSPLDQLPNEQNEKADYLWRTNQPNPNGDGPSRIDLNSMNIELGALNQIKFIRDESNMPTDSVFWSDDLQSTLQNSIDGPDGFAPPGTRIGIKGTPSLSRINTIVIGVRNTSDDGTTLDDVNVWVNELRVSGYDEDTGIAALINADVELADLARVKANLRTQTDGFGSLSSSLGERDQTNIQDWAVNTQVNLDKFIPERFGWSLPVTMEVKSSTTTPRFDPNRGDVRVNELLNAIEADEALSQDEISTRQQEITEQAQTHTATRSFTSRVQKNGSRSRLLRNTVDGLSLSYSFTESKGRSPTQSIRNSWRWTSTFGYRLSIRRPRVFRPFGFLGDVPVLGVLGGLRFNYLPSAVNFTAGATRNFAESRERPDPVSTSANLLPLDVEYPLRPQHTFSHNRQFSLQYNPFGFLNLNFDSNTDQSLNALGVDTLFTLIQYQLDDDGNIVLDDNGQPIELERQRASRDLLDEALRSGAIDSVQVGSSAFQLENLNVTPFSRTINRAFNSDASGLSIRTERYESRMNATFRPRIEKFTPLNWMSIQDIGYGVTFSWRNGSVGNNTGATIGTAVDLRGGITLRPVELFQKFGFYRKLEEQQEAADQAAQARRTQKEQERQARKEQRRQEREQRRLEREAREAAEAAGQPLPEEETTEAEPDEGPPEETPQEVAEQPAAEPGQDEDTPADSTEEGGGFRLPLPNPLSLLRRTFLAATGVRDLSLTYTGNRRTDATNVGTLDQNGNVVVNYSLLDALFRGEGPPLRYRLGLDRTLDPDNERIINERLQVTDNLTNSDRFQARTTLNPSRNLRISLNWSLETNDRNSLTYRRLEDGSVIADTTQTGDNRVSVWAFGASYLDLFNRQLAQFREDCGPDCLQGAPPSEFTSTVLTNEDVFEDFVASYLTGSSTLGSARLPFPLPGWQVNYAGIANWPLIRRIAQSATLRHNYNADYGADFRTNLRAGEEGDFSLQNGTTIIYTVPDVEIGAVRINERFQPLIALDLTLKGNVQTSVGWNKSNTFSLSTTNNVVSETQTSELTFTASYQKTGMSLPFIKSRLNNRVNFSLTLSRSINDDRTFSIRRALEDAALDPDFDPKSALEDPYSNVLTKTSRFQVTPKIAYQFSNRVSADFFVKYENFIGDSRRPSTTTVNGGFNIRVSISN